MTSVKSILNCMGSGTGSLLRHLFGFIRSRVPTDPDTSVRAEVSVLRQVRAMQSDHIHINVIHVGFDAIPGDLDEEEEKIDYAIYRTRNAYAPIGLGVGRVQHYVISAAESDGMDDLGSEDEADDLIAAWSVPNEAMDAFVVRNISSDTFVGKAADIPGSCNKRSGKDGVVAGEIGRDSESFSRTFAHEIGHHLGLFHTHGDDCPGNSNGCNNLMAQTRCAKSCGDGVRKAMLLTTAQGNTMRSHCAVRNGC